MARKSKKPNPKAVLIVLLDYLGVFFLLFAVKALVHQIAWAVSMPISVGVDLGLAEELSSNLIDGEIAQNTLSLFENADDHLTFVVLRLVLFATVTSVLAILLSPKDEANKEKHLKRIVVAVVLAFMSLSTVNFVVDVLSEVAY